MDRIANYVSNWFQAVHAEFDQNFRWNELLEERDRKKMSEVGLG